MLKSHISMSLRRSRKCAWSHLLFDRVILLCLLGGAPPSRKKEVVSMLVATLTLMDLSAAARSEGKGIIITTKRRSSDNTNRNQYSKQIADLSTIERILPGHQVNEAKHQDREIKVRRTSCLTSPTTQLRSVAPQSTSREVGLSTTEQTHQPYIITLQKEQLQRGTATIWSLARTPLQRFPFIHERAWRHVTSDDSMPA